MSQERFEVIEKQGNSFKNIYQVIVDNRTGVNYLFVKDGYGAGLTPLLDENGKPIITK